MSFQISCFELYITPRKVRAIQLTCLLLIEYCKTQFAPISTSRNLLVMSLRTVAEIKQPSPTLPPAQSCCSYSIQIVLPDSDCHCQSLGLPTLHNSPKSDNLDLIAVGAKRERKSRSPTSPSGSLSPTGQRNLERTFASVETQTSPRVSTGRSFWTQTPPTEPPVTRSPEAYYTAERSDYGQA